MKPTNLYLMTLNEIYSIGHIDLQMQGGILHSENHVFLPKFEILKSSKITWTNAKWRFWNGKTLRFPKVLNYWKFEWPLPILPSFIGWSLGSLWANIAYWLHLKTHRNIIKDAKMETKFSGSKILGIYKQIFSYAYVNTYVCTYMRIFLVKQVSIKDILSMGCLYDSAPNLYEQIS